MKGKRSRAIDIHAHVLPGFDDGAGDWQAAVTMCRRAAADGVVALAATPHFFRGIFPTPELATVHSAVSKLNELCKKGLLEDFTIVAGGDCHLAPEVLESARSRTLPTINRSRYFLLELPDHGLPNRLEELVFQLCVEGVVPIITHPERNEVLRREPLRLYDLLQAGAFAQVTANSLLGGFGESAQHAAEYMIKKGLVQTVASDAHDTEARPPIISTGRQAASGLIGDRLATAMTWDVPRAIVKNLAFSFPEPVRPSSRQQKRSWLDLRGKFRRDG